jgi:hypothetical protein
MRNGLRNNKRVQDADKPPSRVNPNHASCKTLGGDAEWQEPHHSAANTGRLFSLKAAAWASIAAATAPRCREKLPLRRQLAILPRGQRELAALGRIGSVGQAGRTSDRADRPGARGGTRRCFGRLPGVAAPSQNQEQADRPPETTTVDGEQFLS